MSNRHAAVDPELAKYVSAFPDLDFQRRPLSDIRSDVLAAFARGEPASDSQVLVERLDIASETTQVFAYLYRPREAGPAKLPAVLHFHPGGFILGSAAMSDARNRALALELSCAVCSVDYRLAPEAPHPAQLNDGCTALRWLQKHAEALRIDPARIALKGESAGGGIAAAVALAARDAGGPPVAHLHLIQPMLDDRTASSVTASPSSDALVWTARCNAFAWEAVLGRVEARSGTRPHAAPARAQDLTGMPPTFISVGALDLFLDEDLEFGRRLRQAGVSLEMHVYPGAYHGFDLIPDAAVAQRARHDSTAALGRALL